MDKSTTISTSIAASSNKANYDAACKQILAEKIILAWIMKYTMREYASLEVEDIADKCIFGAPQVGEVSVLPDETNAPKIQGTGVEDSTITEGSVTYDIRFFAVHPADRTQTGMIINVEAQNNFYPGYPLTKRALYYCSRTISAQYGTEFTNSHYEKIKKVYSVWICMNPPVSRKNTINDYSITETAMIGNVHEKIHNYDLLSAIIICLGDPDKAEEHSLLRLLDVLLSRSIDTAAKKRILSHEFGIPMTQNLERRVSDMCNLSEYVFQEGVEHGMEKQLISSVRSIMTTLHCSLEQAMDALQVSPDDRKKIITRI